MVADDYTSLLGEVEAYVPPYANETDVDYTNTFIPAETGPLDTRLLSDILGMKYDSKPQANRRSPKASGDLFDKVIQAESGGNHRAKGGGLLTSSAGAQGITQIMPATGKKPGYGIRPLQSDSEEEYLRVGRELLAAYTKEFDGDAAKGLAAYNWGPGNVKKTLAKHGDNWKKALPTETAKYLDKILGETNA